MKICFINTFDNKGGAAEIMWSIKNRLEKNNVMTSVFVDKKYSTDGHVKEIGSSFLRKILTYALSNDMEFYNSDIMLKDKAYLESDLVHVHNIHGYYFNLNTLAEIIKVKPVIWTLHDMWALTPHCAHSFEKKPEDNGFYKCASLNVYPKILFHNEKALMKKKAGFYKSNKLTLVAPSLWMKKQIEKSVLRDQDIRLIYNGIDTNVFKIVNKNTARKELGIVSKKKILLYVAHGGKHNPWKGWEDIENIKKIFSEKIDFICLGGNEKKHENNVYYLPYVNNKTTLAKYYVAADGFIYPTRADTFGLVVAEALACGTPVITYSVGGIPEIVDNGVSGFLAKQGDLDDLIKKIDLFINASKDRLEKMGREGSKRVNQKFNVDDMYKNYLALYKEKIW
jgi:glycosyltransferase involved in cell wall biosynthesis